MKILLLFAEKDRHFFKYTFKDVHFGKQNMEFNANLNIEKKMFESSEVLEVVKKKKYELRRLEIYLQITQ